MVYSYEMFIKDTEAINNGLELTEDVKIPEDEWPRIAVEEWGVISLNVNVPHARVARFFKSKYRRDHALDYTWRWWSICDFVVNHSEQLTQLGAVCVVEDDIHVRDDFQKMLFDSFKDPQTPNPVPCSDLYKSDGEGLSFDFEKVLKAWKNIPPAQGELDLP